MNRIIAVNSPESNGPFIVIDCLITESDVNIQKNQSIISLSGDKVQIEITSPVNGILKHLAVQEGEVVQENSVLFLIEIEIPENQDNFSEDGVNSNFKGGSKRLNNFLENKGIRRESKYSELSSKNTDMISEDECKAMIAGRPFDLNLENTYNCATVRFSWEDTKDIIHHGIIVYRVDWDWKYIPDHYTKHEDELYYVFLDPEDISIEVLENVLGNKSYSNVDKTQLKQIVSFGKLHVASNGQFRTQPSAIMATVAMAIGIQEMKIAQIVRDNSVKKMKKQLM